MLWNQSLTPQIRGSIVEGFDYNRISVYFGKWVNEWIVQRNKCNVVISYLAKFVGETFQGFKYCRSSVICQICSWIVQG